MRERRFGCRINDILQVNEGGTKREKIVKVTTKKQLNCYLKVFFLLRSNRFCQKKCDVPER